MVQRCVGGWTTAYVMEIAVKMVERSSEGAGGSGAAAAAWAAARGTPSPPPASWGSATPNPLPSWLHGSPPPWRWDPWGRLKRGSGVCKFVGGGVPHELGFLPLYSLSDSRLPILGRNGAGLARPSGLGIRWIFMSRTFTVKFPTSL
jgi:hypothetical protein